MPITKGATIFRKLLGDTPKIRVLEFLESPGEIRENRQARREFGRRGRFGRHPKASQTAPGFHRPI